MQTHLFNQEHIQKSFLRAMDNHQRSQGRVQSIRRTSLRFDGFKEGTITPIPKGLKEEKFSPLLFNPPFHVA